ncbi:MAG: FAD-binding oxidoreductase [Proteobacteria bacterium]|nr:FAD-binding oxidoreductase [Pseudomonadota bacterium]
MTGTNPSTGPGRAVVVGAGIVGTCCALYLQRAGMAVTLIDRDGPGEGCSSGNAGNLGNGACVPSSLPGTVPKVPAMLLDPMHPLSIRWRHLPAALPWFVRFARAGRPARVEAIADALHSLQSRLFDAYAPLIADAGAADLIRRDGKLFVYESRAAFEGDSLGIEIRRRRGIELEDLDGDDVRRMEPALGPNVACGRFQKDTGHTVDPLRLVQALADSFAANGGTVLRERVTGFDRDGPALRGVVTDAGVRRAPIVVLAAGAWSGRLVAQLGYRVPLESEGGYHVMLPEPGVNLRIPVLACERKVILSPMADGLRLTGIAEFAGLDAPADYRRADVLVHHGRQMLPGLNVEGGKRWRGHRPSTPDSLPVIGPAPRHPNLIFAFGHGRLGLGLGAITGRLVAQMATGQPTDVDPAPFRYERFLRKGIAKPAGRQT